MTEPTFTRSGSTALYWADPSDPVAAFLASSPDALGGRPTLRRTWDDTAGCYVFLGAPATDSAGFLQVLRTWLALYTPQQAPRFLWVADPASAPTAWATTVLACRRASDGTWAADGATFPLTEYRLAVSGGGAITPADTPAGWGFAVTDHLGRSAASLYSPDRWFPGRPATTVLSMEPGHTGAWRFVIDAPAGAGDAFAQLGAGIRFFAPGPDGYVHTVRFAAVRQPDDTALEFHTQVDPLRPLDGDHTSLSFFPWTAQGTPPPTLPSGYVTVLGHGVGLRPLATGTAPPARLVFGLAPYFADEPGNRAYHLTPEGTFGVDAGPGGGRVVCGTSGLEYLGVPAEGCALTFVAGRPAYAPLTSATSADSLTSHGTTAWVSVEPTTSVTYYSQPEDAPLFAPAAHSVEASDGTEAGDGVDLMGFCEIPAAAVGSTPFPMAPFRGLAPDAVSDALKIEQLAIAPTRRTALLPVRSGTRPADTAPTVAVTPQGMSVGLTGDLASWNWLGVGHNGDEAAVPDLRFTTVTGRFQQAMQTNNLFLVLGDPDEFHRFGSVAYQLSTQTLNTIATIPVAHGGIRPPVLAAVSAAMRETVYETRAAFTEALREAAPGITEDETRVFLRYGGLLSPVVAGWRFRLSPDAWRPSTHLIVKFALGRSIADLAADISTWAWPEAASRSGEPADARTAILDAIEAARGEPDGSPYREFYEIATDINWTGVLALSVEVPLDQLPDELQVLAAGIDPGNFTAHHVGISLTPYRLADGQLAFRRSAMFALIDYQNPEDQYFSENITYAFRVLRLTVGVRNSVTTTFTSRAELLVNRLFGAPARLLPTTHGNNILLDGALQHQRLPDGTTHDTYVFAMSGQNTFLLDGLVLQSVELLSTQLVTARASDPRVEGAATVEAVFQMGGNLRFHEPEKFDPFCWGKDAADVDGYLRFGGLAVVMSFDLGDPAGTTRFSLRDGDLSFDAANSTARADSLASRFPIQLRGLIATADPTLATGDPPPPQTPADLGYVSVLAPLDQSPLTQPWYGLDYAVDLGTLGALAGSQALTLHVLAAWSPGGPDTDPGLYLGVRLPGADGLLGVNLPLEGVVKVGFKSVEFLVAGEPGERTYTLRLRDFALRLLGLSFPPGHNDMILFGNPDQSGPSKVGWYLAYASDADPKRPAPAPVRAEIVRRRAGRRSAEGD